MGNLNDTRAQKFAFCSLLATLAAARTAPISPRTLATVDEADSARTLYDSRETPKVLLNGYQYGNSGDLDAWQTTADGSTLDLGIAWGFWADVFASYQALAFWLSQAERDFLVFNPNVYGEASVMGEFTLKLLIVELTVQAKLLGWRGSPADYQFSWDLNEKSRYCWSFGAFQEVFDFTVTTDLYVYECFAGLIGWITTAQNSSSGQDIADCVWRRYTPQLPIFEATFLDRGDTVHDYIPWSCSDYEEVETTNNQEPVDYDGDGIVDDDSNWEPSNIVE